VGSKLASHILSAFLQPLAADPRVTQMVNGSKGIHAVLDKKHFAR